LRRVEGRTSRGEGRLRGAADGEAVEENGGRDG